MTRVHCTSEERLVPQFIIRTEMAIEREWGAT